MRKGGDIMTEFIQIPIITVIAYIVGEMYKQIFSGDKARRFIPIVAAIVGAFLGAIIFFVSPEVAVGETIWDALLVGIISGESATGTNQIIKQIFKKEEREENEHDT